MTLPHVAWRKHGNGALSFVDERFNVTVTRVRGERHGYTGIGWAMRFHRGGSHATSFSRHRNGEAANAARIIGHSLGTHDVLGNELARRDRRPSRSRS